MCLFIQFRYVQDKLQIILELWEKMVIVDDSTVLRFAAQKKKKRVWRWISRLRHNSYILSHMSEFSCYFLYIRNES
jgi:hypothetical protein